MLLTRCWTGEEKKEEEEVIEGGERCMDPTLGQSPDIQVRIEGGSRDAQNTWSSQPALRDANDGLARVNKANQWSHRAPKTPKSLRPSQQESIN